VQSQEPLQVLFADVPAALVSSGRCFLVVNVIRVGALKMDGSPSARKRMDALQEVRTAVSLRGAPKSVAEASAMGNAELAAAAQQVVKGPGIYRRPLGCAVQ